MQKKLFIVLTVLSFAAQMHAQDTSIDPDSTQSFDAQMLSVFDKYTEGYVSENEDRPYEMYFVKFKKTWFILQTTNHRINAFIYNPPQLKKESYKGSDFLKRGMTLTFKKSFLDVKEKEKTVGDVNTTTYYKPDKRGKKVLKGLLALEFPKAKPKKFIIF